ncbi:MAG: hypothetical protein Q4B84_02670 [Clostridia bacterium]|nr:hypothetical protein [Clostridia bacterium]
MFTKLKKAGLLALAMIPALVSTSSAFFIGSDKYTKEQYAEAGINWEHNKILLDNYDFKGRNISQSSAEKITDLYLECFKGNKITNKDSENVTSSIYYRLISEFLDISKKYEKENSILRSKNSSLYLENIKLRTKLSQEKEKNNQAKEKKDTNTTPIYTRATQNNNIPTYTYANQYMPNYTPEYSHPTY